MTGRHAAAPDELFDQQERESAGAHRADVGAAVAGPAAVAAPGVAGPTVAGPAGTTAPEPGSPATSRRPAKRAEA